MKYGLVGFGALFLVGLFCLRGQSPDEKYVTIYNLIQQGDALLAKEAPRPAAEKYLQAKTLLETYPTQYPGWNQNVVSYRLNYLADKLKQLSSFVPNDAQTNQTGNIQPSPAVPPNESMKALQDELARLNQLNADLEAKLKEALSVRPAAIDPHELAKAQQQNQELQKEIELLKVTIEQERSKPAPAPAPTQSPATPVADAETRELEKILIEDFKSKLLRQNALVEKLRQENTDLKAQLALARTAASYALPADTNKLADELLIAKTTINALQSTNIALKTETIMLESRIEDLTQAVTQRSSSKVKQLVAERDELKQKLEIATRQLERSKNRFASLRTDDLAERLEAVLAKLDVFEAKAVPYTPEEMAMFKQGDDQVGNKVLNAEKKTIKELPPGSGPLIAEAQRASAVGRYAEAEQLYLQVLHQDETHVFTLSSLAAVQVEQNRLDDAEKTLKKALSSDPQDPASLYLLGRIKYLQGKYDEAFEALSLSAKIIPNEARTQYFLGKTLMQKGQRSAAETALRKAVQLQPGYGEAHHALALIYATQKPPFIELAQWHYNKALDSRDERGNKFPPDPELEKLIAKSSSASTKP